MDTILECNSLLFCPHFYVLGTFCNWIDICPPEQRLHFFFFPNLVWPEVDALEAIRNYRMPPDMIPNNVPFVRSVIGFLRLKKGKRELEFRSWLLS